MINTTAIIGPQGSEDELSSGLRLLFSGSVTGRLEDEFSLIGDILPKVLNRSLLFTLLGIKDFPVLLLFLGLGLFFGGFCFLFLLFFRVFFGIRGGVFFFFCHGGLGRIFPSFRLRFFG